MDILYFALTGMFLIIGFVYVDDIGGIKNVTSNALTSIILGCCFLLSFYFFIDVLNVEPTHQIIKDQITKWDNISSNTENGIRTSVDVRIDTCKVDIKITKNNIIIFSPIDPTPMYFDMACSKLDRKTIFEAFGISL